MKVVALGCELADLAMQVIACETGRSRKQLIRLAARLRDEGVGAVLAHGNGGSRPGNAVGLNKVVYLLALKEPYPNVTFAHFRDIYIEGVIDNTAKAADVERCGRVAQGVDVVCSAKGWRSPSQRGPRRDTGGWQHTRRAPLPRAGMMAQVDGTHLRLAVHG